jgi:hypothetical protein
MTQGEMFSDLALEQQYDNMIKVLKLKLNLTNLLLIAVIYTSLIVSIVLLVYILSI